MVFFTCILNFFNHFIHFSLKNSELNVENNTLSRKKNFVFLFFIRKNNEWIKKCTKKKCVALFEYISIFFIGKSFFQTFFDRVDNTCAGLRERVEFFDPGG